MKKSQLRKIIKESIKGLIKEQSSPIRSVELCPCYYYDIPNNTCSMTNSTYCTGGDPSQFAGTGCPAFGSGPNGGQISNKAIIPVGATSFANAVPPVVGDKICWAPMSNNSIPWSGQQSLCMNNQEKIVMTVMGPATSTSSSSSGYEIPNYTCGFGITPGCTDSTATNYNPYATTDDGSCIAMVYGCMDPNAFNYYPGAAADDGSCAYMPGCMDHAANNYNVDADIDDGSCDYEPTNPGPNPDIPPSTAGTTSDCSELVVQVTNALAPQTFECAQDAMNNNQRFDSISVGRCVLIPTTGDIATILEVNPGITAHPTVIEMVPCSSGPTGPTGPTPAPQSQCSNLVVSNLTSIATQQFNCVQNNGASFPPTSIGKCVIIQGQQYKIEEVEPSTGMNPIPGETVQCSLAEGAILRMQKLANIKK